jgi:transitional endoplasmic reticulum ATPase
MKDEQSILKRKDRFKDFEVQFFIAVNDGAEIFRIKDNEGVLGMLKLYPFMKLSSLRFSPSNELYEIEILKALNHKNIACLKTSGETIINGGKYIYLITEFISGESCLQRLKRQGKMNPYTVILLTIDLLETVGYLHSFEDPIIHNDLTIENVYLNYSENKEIPVITNFSSAIKFSRSTKYFSNELLNPFYMAPEQYSNISLPQSDLFSIGALMYNLIFGIPPWFVESKNRDELLQNIPNARKKQLSFESTNIEEIDDHVLNVIKKALSTELENRYKTAEDFIRDLKRETVVLSVNVKEKHEKTSVKTIKKGNGFRDIAGMEDLIEILTNDVIKVLNEKEEHEKYGLTIPNGMLLYGPPGCGKTFIAEKFAEEIAFNFISVKPSDLASIYVHGSQEKIGKLFDDARENAPSIIFFDEIDALIPSRQGDINHSYASEVNEFLAQMSDCSKHEVFIIAATNRPEKIDTAILRTGRLDKKIFVGPPDDKAREKLFQLYLEKRPTDFSIDLTLLSKKTEFFVASDIKFVIDEASRVALKGKARITQSILEQIIDNFIPSISKEILNYYESLHNKMENKEDISHLRRPIGFRNT